MAAVLKSGAAMWRDTDATPRFNIYRIIHKGMRGFMMDTLVRVGRMDVTDDCERAQTIEQLRGLLAFCAGHLHHENTVVHPAIEKYEPGHSSRTASEHVAHLVAISALEQQALQFETAPTERLAALAQELYLDLSNFVAENFEHMAVEETENQASLTRSYSDAELLAMEHVIRASLTPEQARLGLRWMLPHVTAAERALMLGGMKRGVPPEVFNGVMALAAEVLSQRDLYKLQQALS
jgi:hypothetical protein